MPDILCFAKKMQVGGIFVSKRIDDVKDNVFRKSGRINSTWGGSLVDMVRCTHILEIIVEREPRRERQRLRGAELSPACGLAVRIPVVTNARGQGLMCAIDLPDRATRDAVHQGVLRGRDDRAYLRHATRSASVRRSPSTPRSSPRGSNASSARSASWRLHARRPDAGRSAQGTTSNTSASGSCIASRPAAPRRSRGTSRKRAANAFVTRSVIEPPPAERRR